MLVSILFSHRFLSYIPDEVVMHLFRGMIHSHKDFVICNEAAVNEWIWHYLIWHRMIIDA
jgi:hypothetical protein